MNSIALSFDLEFWHNSEFLKKELSAVAVSNFDDRVVQQTEKILDLLNRNNSYATFFVLGEVAEKYPNLVKTIFDAGHEIASHGYSHTALAELTSASFEAQIVKTNLIMKSITGLSPVGFRAPAFSLTEKTSWAIPILIKHGFKYDSSIFPSRISHYGHSSAPRESYYISEKNIYRPNPTSPLLEVPVAVSKQFGFRLPIAGGIYFRLFPYQFYKRLVRRHNAKHATLLYFHPHEFDTTVTTYVPSSPLTLKRNLLYINYSSATNKLASLLSDFKGVSIIEKYL